MERAVHRALSAPLGDHAWRTLLDAHHGIARRELERHRGQAIEFVGDGLLTTFDGPARAIRCACVISEIERVDQAIRDIAVHIGARIVGEAGAGEVLVSSTIKDLVAGSGIRFVERGLRVLKGVPDEWRWFAVDTQ